MNDSDPNPNGHVEEKSPEFASNSNQDMGEIDRFIESLSSGDNESNFSEFPECVQSLLKILETLIPKYDLRDESLRFGLNQKQDASFFESMNRISRLVKNLAESPSKSPNSCLDRASSVLHRAVCLMEEEFQALLENSKRNLNSDLKTPKSAPVQSAFNHSSQDFDRNADAAAAGEEFPSFSPDSISIMNLIAKAMIAAGYEAECCMIFSGLRRKAFENELDKLGYYNLSMDDAQRMQWESLENEIVSWISIVKHCSTNLFPQERKLCDSVFSDQPSVAERMNSDLVTAVMMRFLNFAAAVVLTKRATERLFKFLDVYEALRDLISAISDLPAQDLETETTIAQRRIGEATVCIFRELENSIRNDNGRTPVPSGAVHPLTRYTIIYLRYACEYKDTLEQIFNQHPRKDLSISIHQEESETEMKKSSESSQFLVQLIVIMDLLDANLSMRSNLYRDPSLRYIFLMNNGRYIMQKIKGSAKIYEMMGHSWSRKRSTALRQYHENYQRETWSKVLQTLSHEGLNVNGKVPSKAVKERFKNFNSMFDEIHKTQSTWVVSDEQLQSELRVSIASLVIPAYRSFVGRFKQYLDPGKQTEKYIKYQSDDIKKLIDNLFDGNLASMARKRNWCWEKRKR